MQHWITVRMDDGGIVSATLHAAESYPHPHPDYQGDDKPNPLAHVAIDMIAPPAIQEALQAAIDAARDELTSQARIAAMRATVRAADRPIGEILTDEGRNVEIQTGGSTEPTGTSSP